MTFCLNPDCQQSVNPDNAEFCLSCGGKLVPLLRGRYRIERPLGQGGFGRTYLAVDEDRLRAPCVIKQFSPQVQGSKSLEKAIQLFEQEAVRLNELGEHPQIPALLAYFEQDSRLYLVQQFVEGQTLLQELAQQGVFSEQKIREVLVGVLPVLKFVHDHQVIHRDITPSNIIRRKTDNKLVLIDFGVSKVLSADAAAQPGTKIGTEGYAPMEQLRGGKAYPASDIYSLGVTCIYLMTQVRPDELYDPLHGEWLWRERLKERNGRISEVIAQILDKMLKDLVSKRYPTADAVMKDLRAALSRPAAVPGARTSMGSVTHQFSHRFPSAPPSGQVISRGGFSGQPRVSGSPPSRPPLSGSGPQSLLTLQGHSQWVMAVALSPDAQTVVSGGLDDRIQVWDLSAGELLRTLTGHTKPVNCLALSPDGQILASGSDDHTIKIWHMESGKLLGSLTGHSRDVNSVVIHLDGQLLVSGGEDRTVRLWKLGTGELLQVFSGVAGMIRSVALSPDGQIVASGGLDNQIKLWSVRTGELIRTFPKLHFNSVNAVAIHPNGNILVSGSKDKTIKVWNLSTGDMMRSLTGHTDSVNAIALSLDGRWIISGSSDKSIRIWNLNTGELSQTFLEHSNSVNAVAISNDGHRLVSGSSDNTVKIWQIV
jgi:WD40 repeat protein/tRNA A-37 threonylcarbamoyl transferase component Bud32